MAGRGRCRRGRAWQDPHWNPATNRYEVNGRSYGDPAKVPSFQHNPRFVNNPDAIAKAKAIYDGTYEG